MKKLTLISALLSVLSATTTYAQNTVFFDQTDRAGGNSVGIGTLIITQSGSAGNQIGTSGTRAFLKGGAETLTISQINSSSGPNNTAISIYGSDNVARNSFYTFILDGSSNSQNFTYGSLGVIANYDFARAEMSATGDNNSLTADFATGAADGTLDSTIQITGNSNTFNSTSLAGIGTIYTYNQVKGNNNTVAVSFGDSAGRRDSSLFLNGNNNNWSLNMLSSDGFSVIRQNQDTNSNEVTGVVDQIYAPNAKARLTLAKSGAGAFSVNVSQTASNANASVTISALGSGIFTLNQASPASSYDATHIIDAGGTATINQ
jgi:hypothetical protein